MSASDAEKSHRFALAGTDPDGDSRTIMVWQETLFVDGCVVRRVVISLDATWNTATVLTCPEAGEVANAILRAARLAR